MKFAHAKHVMVKNITLKNCKNSHLMEVAAVDGFTVKNSTFKDQVLDTSASVYTYEAIQLDILVNLHFTGYRMEALQMKNVSITSIASSAEIAVLTLTGFAIARICSEHPAMNPETVSA